MNTNTTTTVSLTESRTYTQASNANCVALRQVESIGNKFRSRYIERDVRGKITVEGEWEEWSTRGSRVMPEDEPASIGYKPSWDGDWLEVMPCPECGEGLSHRWQEGSGEVYTSTPGARMGNKSFRDDECVSAFCKCGFDTSSPKRVL